MTLFPLFIKRAILFEKFLCRIDAGIFLYHQTDITKPLLNIGPLFAPNYDVPELRNEKVVAFQTLFNRSFFYRSCADYHHHHHDHQASGGSSPLKFFPCSLQSSPNSASINPQLSRHTGTLRLTPNLWQVIFLQRIIT